MTPRYKLTLFVTPDSSGKALAWLYKALSELQYNDYELSMIDVLQEPAKAKQANIVGTPALIYHSPGGDVLIQYVSDVHGYGKRSVLRMSDMEDQPRGRAGRSCYTRLYGGHSIRSCLVGVSANSSSTGYINGDFRKKYSKPPYQVLVSVCF